MAINEKLPKSIETALGLVGKIDDDAQMPIKMWDDDIPTFDDHLLIHRTDKAALFYTVVREGFEFIYENRNGYELYYSANDECDFRSNFPRSPTGKDDSKVVREYKKLTGVTDDELRPILEQVPGME
ncbi:MULTISPECIES: hypothetical protein [Haloarcula]|uniref:hypothetical protein n=1 Tax=Haloarcula TaxID=2237 RepID=UPI0023E87D41|nr:hypothetical protein [Halomicroarcula sp. SHR3]